MFFLILLKFSKCDKQSFIQMVVAEKLNGSLVNCPGAINKAMRLLESGIFDPILDVGMDHHKSLINFSCPIQFLVSQLKINVSLPSLLLWLPLHPSLEYLTTSRHIFEHLLHVSVLVPELIRSGHYDNSSIPQITSMVHLAVLHLHLGVLEPYCDVPMVVV